MDAVNWLRLSLLLALALLPQQGQCIQVAADPKTRNITQSQLEEKPLLPADNGTAVGDSILSASERNRRLIPYMAFYLPPDFPINQQYSVGPQQPKGAIPNNGKYSKPIALESHLPSAGGLIPVPQEYLHLRAPPPATHNDAELTYAPAPQLHHYLPSAGDVYHGMTYAAGPSPIAISQHTPPPLSQSAINTKSSKVPVLHLLPPGPPGPTVAPIIKHKHKTVQHFPPTKPPAVQQLPYEHHQQPQRQNTIRHNFVQQQPPILTSQHELQQQQQQQQRQQQQQQQQSPVLLFRQQTRPKQSKVNLTPFTPTNTLPGHFIPIIYTPVSGDGNSNDNNNQAANALNYGYDNPTVVLVDDLSPPLQSVNLAHQQQQPQFKPVPLQNPSTNNQYTVASPDVPIETLQQQQQNYITATGALPAAFASQQAEQPTGSAASAPLIPHSTTSPTYHIFNEASAPVHPLTSTPQQKETLLTTAKQQSQLQQQTHPHPHLHQHSQSQQPHRHSTRPRQKHPHFQSPRPEHLFDGTEPTQELQPDDSYAYFNDEIITPQEKYVRYLQQRIRYNKQQQNQRDRVKERENFIQQQQQEQYQQPGGQQQQQQQQQELAHLQQPQSQIVVPSGSTGSASAPTPPPPPSSFAHYSNQQQLDANAQVNYPQHSPIRHAVYPHPELHVPPNHQPPSNVATVKQVVKIPVRTLVSEALDAFQQEQQQQQFLAKGESGGVYRQEPQYANSLGPSTTQYIDYIVDDPKQSLDEEQQHNPAESGPPQKPTSQQNAFIIISTSSPPMIIPGGINQEYYDSTSRPVYKQQPTLRLQPLTQSGKSNNYATRRPIVATAPQPPLHIPQSAAMDEPKYVYEIKPSFGDVIKSPTPAVKLRPSHKYSGGIGSRLAPPAPASPLQHQEKQQVNTPEYYNPPVPVVAKTSPIADPNQLPDIRSSSLAEILHKLQASNHLPRTLTPENIDNSIKTLVTILENLKQTQTIVPNPQQHHEKPAASPDYDYGTSSEEVNGGAPELSSVLSPAGPNKHPGPSTGRAGIDYPNLAEIPQTNFNCAEQRYKGFFGDPETNCQVWHYCDLNGGKASFLCPNGTIFSQIALTCDWWFNVKCSTTAQLYVLNERLYKYILPFTPKFPEDYSGPLVDKYLAMKFQEMEEKMRIEKEKVEKAAIAAAVAATSVTQTSNHIDSEEASGGIDAENDNDAANDENDTEVTTVAPNLRTLPRKLSSPNKLGAVNAHVSEQSSERNFLIDDEVDDISQRGSVDTYESSTIPTASAAAVATHDDKLALSLKPIVVSSTQGPGYDDAGEDEQRVPAHIVRNAEEATSRTVTTKAAQSPTQLLQQENQEEIQASPKPVRQTTNIDVEKVEVIEIKAEGAAGQMGPKMYYGAESAKDVR